MRIFYFSLPSGLAELTKLAKLPPHFPGEYASFDEPFQIQKENNFEYHQNQLFAGVPVFCENF